jgi:hypothetical protein
MYNNDPRAAQIEVPLHHMNSVVGVPLSTAQVAPGGSIGQCATLHNPMDIRDNELFPNRTERIQDQR